MGSGGQLVAGTTAKVVKEDGTLAKVDEPGELYVRGKQNALGYYKNEAAYALYLIYISPSHHVFRTREVFVDGSVP